MQYLRKKWFYRNDVYLDSLELSTFSVISGFNSTCALLVMWSPKVHVSAKCVKSHLLHFFHVATMCVSVAAAVCALA